MEFSGKCDACFRPFLTYLSLWNHLRRKVDEDHVRLRERWVVSRSEYVGHLRCRKCGGVWENRDITKKDEKNCPECRALRASMSGRRYEKIKFEKVADERSARKEEAGRHKGLRRWKTSDLIVPTGYIGDSLYLQVEAALKTEEKVQEIMSRLGISFYVFRKVAQTILGEVAYKEWATERLRRRSSKIRMAWKKPGSGLEQCLAGKLREIGIPFQENVWQTLVMAGKKVHREADLKVELPGGKKIIVLCDGEIFHGPKFLFGNTTERIKDDVDTARAYFEGGYSVVRYSESEILSGDALNHLVSVLNKLSVGLKVLRTWHPPVEEWA